MIQNVAEVRTHRGNLVKFGMRILPDLTVVHDFVADLAGCTAWDWTSGQNFRQTARPCIQRLAMCEA